MWCGDWDFVSELSKNVVAISKCSDDAGSKSLFRPLSVPFYIETLSEWQNQVLRWNRWSQLGWILTCDPQGLELRQT